MARIMTAVFNPTSFLDYIAPLQMYGEEYKKNEAAIAELEGYAANLALRAAKEPNEEWAKKYLLYADSLQRLAENMSSRGLSAALRSDLLNIRRSYFRDIVPIQEAVNTQLKLAELRNAQNIAHPEYRTEWADIPSVSALLETPTLGLTSYSGAAVEKSALEAAASAAMRHGIKDTFEPYRKYWMQTVSERGFTEKEMQQFKDAIAKDPQALGILEDIFRQVKSQYNNFKGMSPALVNKLEAEIISGIFKGAAYNKTVKYDENKPALMALENAFQVGRMKLLRLWAKEDAENAARNLLMKDLNLPEHDVAYTPEESQDLILNMAEHTFDFLTGYARTHNDAHAIKIRRYFDKFRFKDSKKINKLEAIEYLKKYGMRRSIGLIYTPSLTNKTENGNQLTFIGNKLRQSLRQNVTLNEDVINEWSGNWRTSIITPYTTLDKGIFKGKGKLKIKGYSLNLSPKDKQTLLEGAIFSDISDDYVGIYKVRGVDKNGTMLATNTRLKGDEIPRTKDGGIDYSSISIMSVKGGALLTWPGGQGFIPTKNFGKLAAILLAVIELTVSKQLPAYLNEKRNLYLSAGYSPELVEAALRLEEESITKAATQNSVLSPVILNKPLEVKSQTVE